MRVKYLKLQWNVYWFVRRPPKKLHDQLGNKTVNINLKTSDRAVAIRRRNVILGEWLSLVVTPDPADDFDSRMPLSEYIQRIKDNKEKEPQDARKVP